jgi:hypothetical protein
MCSPQELLHIQNTEQLCAIQLQIGSSSNSSSSSTAGPGSPYSAFGFNVWLATCQDASATHLMIEVVAAKK